MTTKPFEFEPALKELEEITQWFESSSVDLDQGLVKFERGMELATQLKSHLTTVENRIEKIKQRFTDTTSTATPTTAGPDPDDDRPPLRDQDQAGLFGA